MEQLTDKSEIALRVGVLINTLEVLGKEFDQLLKRIDFEIEVYRHLVEDVRVLIEELNK